ncbi:hypothetical protein X805_05060 [Sphaerotilus natans subsp. natans DSM 6575]|uniref:Uncharacterized protein n=1 Tax=Sphaerotilus natans subsp. natans DSM 6575 TaxID=1286631 RepID=A0A059KRK9_9BURK|nr:hypothetical protein [Sphaerotilus natans]KDB53874.1 hypothetical protein X805_05060 [Sphaerotilus natans subsp. natans DSM 6575]SIR24515.1 hypothetical protein SAMN05421778_10834 [Sphaerotilus natans]
MPSIHNDKNPAFRSWTTILLAGSAGILVACGGGDDSGSDSTNPDPGIATYAIGGTVSGLSGSLTLKNNGGDTLSLTTSGSFSFPTRLASGSPYAVTVGTQPTGQTCTVAGGSGTVTSEAVASVRVTCAASATSVLAGRTWQPGQLLESSVGDVIGGVLYSRYRVGLSDTGAAVLAFLQEDGSGGESLQVVDGVAGPAGSAPVWTAPVAIDSAAKTVASTRLTGIQLPALAVSPNGQAVVLWASSRDCTASEGCLSMYILNVSRRLSSHTAWEAPVAILQSKNAARDAIPVINDSGDVAILFDGQQEAVNTGHVAVAMRKASEAGYRVQSFTGWPIGTVRELGQQVQMGMDKAGRITLVGEQTNTSNTLDLVAYRGTVAAGFGVTPVAEALEDRSSSATLHGITVGLDGTVAAAFQQTTATTTRATLLSVWSPDSGTWAVARDVSADLGAALSSNWALRVPDGTSGDVLLFSGCTLASRRSGQWLPRVDLPADCGLNSSSEFSGLWAMDRNGNYMAMNSDSSLWRSYDVAANRMIKAIPGSTPVSADYLLGVAKDPRGGYNFGGSMALSVQGLGVMVVRTPYTQMPSAAAPNGDSATPQNLFGFYFK